MNTYQQIRSIPSPRRRPLILLGLAAFFVLLTAVVDAKAELAGNVPLNSSTEDQSMEDMRSELQIRQLEEQLKKHDLRRLQMELQERQLLVELNDQDKGSFFFGGAPPPEVPSPTNTWVLSLAIFLLTWCLVAEASRYLARLNPADGYGSTPATFPPLAASAVVFASWLFTKIVSEEGHELISSGYSLPGAIVALLLRQPEETTIVFLAASVPPGILALFRIAQLFLQKMGPTTPENPRTAATPLLVDLPDGQLAAIQYVLEGARAYSQLQSDARSTLYPKVAADPKTGTEFKFTIVEPYVQTGGHMGDNYHVKNSQIANNSPMAAVGHENLSEGNVNVASSEVDRKSQVELLDQLIEQIRELSGNDRPKEIVIAERNLERVKEELTEEENPDPDRVSRWLVKVKDTLETLNTGSALIKKAREVLESFGIPW